MTEGSFARLAAAVAVTSAAIAVTFNAIATQVDLSGAPWPAIRLVAGVGFIGGALAWLAAKAYSRLGPRRHEGR